MSPKTIFVTGASGYIGSAFLRIAVQEGYTVRGLSRSKKSDEKIKTLGGIPVRGELSSLDVLAREAGHSDIVCSFGDAFAGSGYTMEFSEAIAIHNAAIDAMAGAMEGSKKSLVVSSGALITKPKADGSETTEEDPDHEEAFLDRGSMSRHALAWASRGVNISLMRLAP